MRGLRRVFLGLAVAPLLVVVPTVTNEASAGSADLETDLENVREALGIPGMAAAVVHNQQLVWYAGFGFADSENQLVARPSTPFGLASVTKPIAATLIMQLVAEDLVDLDTLVSSYGVDLPNGDGVTVRHLLTHTSEGIPGTVHEYNGNRYAYLGGVIEGATGRTFSELLGERILVPLALKDTALNPIDTWGEAPALGLEEFSRALGWSDSFGHYPDVYARLAQPYQFDNDYSIIPGMYHLTHNPAAGGISSVADLAKFDIALDAGLLLDDLSRTAMLSPAVPTAAGRSDLAYGLGWYVQDTTDLRLVWHAGRWPPSTSALYLKIPELELTFVVLANTDNLTVPFPGIGDGDVTGSLPALTFLRHYVFRELHETDLPQVDWWASDDVLVEQLTVSNDPNVVEFLERELWSYRQAFASSGQFERADVLASVVRDAFPESRMRWQSSFTSTVGKMPIESPVLSAASIATMSRLTLAWLAIVALSLVWMASRVVPPRDGWWWATAIWLLAALLLGPIAVLARQVIRRQGEETVAQVLGASLFCAVGYSVAWVISIWLLLEGGEEPNPLATLLATIFVPVIVGLFLVRAPMLMRVGVTGIGKAARRGLLAEVITWSLGLAVFVSVTLFFDNRWLTTIPYPTSPFFGAMISLGALLALTAFLPLHLLLRSRGYMIWSSSAASSATATVRLPTFRNSWWILLATLVTMVAGVAFSATSFQ